MCLTSSTTRRGRRIVDCFFDFFRKVPGGNTDLLLVWANSDGFSVEIGVAIAPNYIRDGSCLLGEC